MAGRASGNSKQRRRSRNEVTIAVVGDNGTTRGRSGGGGPRPRTSRRTARRPSLARRSDEPLSAGHVKRGFASRPKQRPESAERQRRGVTHDACRCVRLASACARDQRGRQSVAACLRRDRAPPRASRSEGTLWGVRLFRELKGLTFSSPISGCYGRRVW